MTTVQSIQSATHNPSIQQVRAVPSQVKIEGEVELEAVEVPYNQNHLALLKVVIEQFCDKYLESYSGTTVRHLLRKVVELGGGRRQKCSRELVAAVVYCQYSGIIRLKLKDFAFMNQLSPKAFNKRYVAYQTLLKRNRTHNQDSKKEEKEEDCPTKEEDSSDKPQGVVMNMGVGTNMGVGMRAATPRQAIELIYDGIFKSQQFQSNRRDFIEKMGDICTEIDPRIYQQMHWTDNPTVKLYYAIFEHLKQLGMHISFTKFREAVETFAGLHLKMPYAQATERIFKSIQNEQQDQLAQRYPIEGI